MNKVKIIALLVGFASIGFASVSQAVPTPLHNYEFNGDLSDGQGGAAIASEGGTVGATTYEFNPTLAPPSDFNQGLTLESPGLGNPGVYSIEMKIRLDSLRNITPVSQPWVKLIDFKNQTLDDGFYTEDSGGFGGTGVSSLIEFFGAGFAASADPVVFPNQWVHLVLTRDAAGNVTAYTQGAEAFSDVDAAGDLVFSTANNVMRFLQDDNVSPNYGPPGGPVYETTPGEIDFLRIYDSALSASDVAALVPEPSSFVLALIGLAAVLWIRRR
jgi:hypothetical protein